MRRIALLLGATALIGYGVAAALGGCGGDDTPATPDPNAGSTSSGSTSSGDQSSGSTSGDQSSGSTSGGTSGSTSGNPEGGTSSSGSLGASNPGRVTCGASECDAGGNFNNVVCCYRDAGAMCGRQQGPGNPPDECSDNTFQTECDEPADCPALGGGGGTRACCLRLQQGVARAQTCAQFGGGCGNGGGDGIRVCKTNADCGDAGACAIKTCGGRMIGVCGTPQGCQ